MRRVGVDVGGTFTDLVVYDEDTREVFRTKVPTTPLAPEEGLLNACRQAEVDASQVLDFMHATTLVTNLIITRTGARVGLITTKGFRDVLEIGRSYRQELYNLQWEKPKHFVPRHLVREVTERIDHKGNVLTTLERGECISVVQSFLADGVDAIAVCLFNSYANPAHERVLAEVILELSPTLCYSLSSEVDPRIREYPRVSTCVLNAYAMPKVHSYIQRLDEAVGTKVKYMHSGGGIIPSKEVRRFPILLVESGPAAGVLAAKFIGEKVGIKNIITADTGGTSFDVGVIRDGEPGVKAEIEVEWGIPARVQSIDVNSIGCGGGGIAWIDEGGALRVGPQSAGARPGPACFDLGGKLPTVTDANLVLGILNPDNMLGGQLKVSLERAREALQPIAAHFDTTLVGAALGIHRIVNANMAQAVLEATVKKGIDTRMFTLIPFGGAGGQHAMDVAQQVGVSSVLVPPQTAAFSAFGLLTADLKNTVAKTVLSPLNELDLIALANLLEDLSTGATKFLDDEGGRIKRTELECSLDIRYIGQSNEVTVQVDFGKALDRDAIYRDFERAHRIIYGTQLGDPAELVNVRLTSIGRIEPLQLAPSVEKVSRLQPRPKGFRRVALFDSEVAIYDRSRLKYGMTLRGPCIVEDVDSTLVILERSSARVDRLSNIIVNFSTARKDAHLSVTPAVVALAN